MNIGPSRLSVLLFLTLASACRSARSTEPVEALTSAPPTDELTRTYDLGGKAGWTSAAQFSLPYYAQRNSPRIGTRLFTPAVIKIPDLRKYASVGMIAFPRAPSSAEELIRYGIICQAYLSVLSDAIRMHQIDPKLRQMATLWPRRDITKPMSFTATGSRAARYCVRAVNEYSYGTAAAWMAGVPKRAGLKQGRRGPFIVAWAPPSGRTVPPSSVLVFDMTDFESRDAIQRAFGIWKSEIENDPALWRKGWSTERWKAHTAAKLDRYGKQIRDAMTLVPWLKS